MFIKNVINSCKVTLLRTFFYTIQNYWSDPEASYPDTYHEMKWKMDCETCHSDKNCVLHSGNTDYRMTPYSLCVRSELPLTKTIKFQDVGNDQLEFDNGELMINNEPPNIDHIGHQLPCRGDSGIGHWMMNGQRFVMVGITTNGMDPCGSAAIMQKTTYKDILTWIKEKIEDDDLDIVQDAITTDATSDSNL